MLNKLISLHFLNVCFVTSKKNQLLEVFVGCVFFLLSVGL